jgi:hypothetical protein
MEEKRIQQHKQEQTILPADTTPAEVNIASSILPYSYDDNKARFLSYRSCGLSPREAIHLMGLAPSTISFWRTDAKFVELESKIPELQDKLAKDYIKLEFFRNFRLVLEQDYRILKKVLTRKQMSVTLPNGTEDEIPIPLSTQEHDYLMKMRGQYTPQQLQVLEGIVGSKESGFDFAEWVSKNADVVQASRTTETMTFKKQDTAPTFQVTDKARQLKDSLPNLEDLDAE